MHYFKLFLASTFAVSAALKMFVTFLAANGVWLQTLHMGAVGNSILRGVLAVAAGALIAKHFHYRNVPKARH